MASMMNIIEEAQEDRSVARTDGSPYALNPEGERDGPDERDQQRSLYDRDAECLDGTVRHGRRQYCAWCRRSHALAGYPYGRDFRYREAVMTGRGIGGWLKGTSDDRGARCAGRRRLVQAQPASCCKKFVLPKPGEGPSPELQQDRILQPDADRRAADGRSCGHASPAIRIRATAPPARCSPNAAVCLAKDDLDTSGGVLTPAFAMARPLLERLRRERRADFDVVD